ncbi:MAG TPA: hypothetical protein VGM74_00155 [Burkholderiaceae bacterium]|jgi:hypothetical protein
MLLVRPRPASEANPRQALVAKVEWIDRYRDRLTQSLPQLAPIDAALLAVEAYALQHAAGAQCPDESASRYAAARVALFG